MASSRNLDGSYERVWFEELVAPDEVSFDSGVFLLTKDSAKVLKVEPSPKLVPQPRTGSITSPQPPVDPGPGATAGASTKTLRLIGSVPPEIWNRLGTKILPKLRAGSDLTIGLNFSVTVNADTAQSLGSELRQVLQELGLAESVRIE